MYGYFTPCSPGNLTGKMGTRPGDTLRLQQILRATKCEKWSDPRSVRVLEQGEEHIAMSTCRVCW